VRDWNPVYRQLTDRNRGFINPGEQERLRRYHVAVLGLGLGAQIVELMVRTGFNRITVADGGLIEETNLNRQPWTLPDTGREKTRVLHDRVRTINPHIRLAHHDRMLKHADIAGLLDEVHIVINAVGIEELPLTVEIHRQARARGIPVIEPINAGWCGGLFVFSPNGPSFEELIELRDDDDLEALAANPAQLLPYWSNLVHQHMPEHLREPMVEYLYQVGQDGYCALPQLGAGVYITAGVVVTTLVRIALERPVKLAPEFIFLDPIEAAEPLSDEI